MGRTGDSSSSNAQSPFNRMDQHLGFNKRSNVLRRRLKAALAAIDNIAALVFFIHPDNVLSEN